MSRSLPTYLSVKFLQKEARKLIKAHRTGDVRCCETLRHHARFSHAADEEILKAQVTLQEAHHAVSVDYGFRNWKELRTHVESMASDEEEKTALAALAVGVAYDINNLLLGIQGRTAIMLVNKRPGQNDYEHLKGIEEYVKGGANLVRQSLAVAQSRREDPDSAG